MISKVFFRFKRFYLFVSLLLFAIIIRNYVTSDKIYFLVTKPEKLNYIYRINPSYAVGIQLPSFTYENTKLLLADPPEGCSGFDNAYDIKGEVVLIERGECSFAEKVLNAEKAGALMALITDSKAGTNEAIEMISDNVNPRANIPAAFLPGVNGRVLRNYLTYEYSYLGIEIPLNYTVRVPEYNTPPWEL